MQKKVQYTITLTIVSLLASLGVSSTFLLTKNTIKKKELAARTEALYRVLPGLEGAPVEITPPNVSDQDRIYKGLDKSGHIIGYAACGEAQGYSSKIKVMVGIDSHFEKVIGISVLAQNETPGLGTKMTEVESNATWWSVIFGREAESFNVKAFDDDSGFEAWKLPVYEQVQRAKNVKQATKAADKPQPWFQEQFKHKTHNQLIVTKVPDPEKILAITGATISTKAVINAVQNALDKVTRILQPTKWEIK
ncbi:MAG: FMN-binding protein [Planctomycetota bacterium]